MHKGIDTKGLAEPDLLKMLDSLEPGGSIACVPFVDDKNIYFGASDSYIYSIDKKLASVNWKFRCRGIVGISSPVIFNGILYTGSLDGYCYALDPKDGRLIWEFRTSGKILNTPRLFDNKLFISSTDGNLYCLENTSGKLLWQKHLGSLAVVLSSIVNGNVFVGSWVERNYQCISPEGKVLWKVNIDHWPDEAAFATPDGEFLSNGCTFVNAVDVDEFVFIIPSWSSRLYLCDDKGKILWKESIESSLVVPTIEKGNIYAGSLNGNIYSLSLKDASQNWKYTTGDTVISNTPVIHNGVAYTGSCDGNIYALNPEDGRLIWRFQTAGPVISPAVFSGNIMYIGSWDAHLYAFDISDPKSPRLLWKFATGIPPSAPKFINWIGDFEKFKEKYLNLQWKPETFSALQEQGKKSPYAGPAGIGDEAAFSRSAYAGFRGAEAYQKQDSPYAGKRGDKKKDAYSR